jgi:hypothetical protein
MKQITEISQDPLQVLEIVTEENKTFEFTLQYREQQGGWFFSLNYEDVIINNSRLTNSPNILNQYKNILPFGLLVFTIDFSEPFLIDDFSSERVKLYLLNEEEVQEVANNIL